MWTWSHLGQSGSQGVWGISAMKPTGGMGSSGIGHMGISGTGGMGYKGPLGTRGMGHMGNGVHGQRGPWAIWAMGPMGNLDFFAYNFINTEWILTKILLDIDIDVFYLNTGQFFHNGLN